MLHWPNGVDVIRVGEIDSTNLEGHRLADKIEGPTWILAESQTAGRGRCGRSWTSPKGNFCATLIVPFSGRLQDAALMSFVASVALYDALAGIAEDGERLRAKWPNDLLLDDGKVAGILLETAGTGGRMRVLIGIGVNLATAPQVPLRYERSPRSVCLSDEFLMEVTPDRLLDHLAPAMDRRLGQFRVSGFDPIRQDWLRIAARLGQEVIFRTSDREIRGVFETIDSDGCAAVLAEGNRYRIAAADMLLR